MKKVLLKVFCGITAFGVLLAAYAAGQITAFLPFPEYFFWGALVAIALLIFGFFCGTYEGGRIFKKSQKQIVPQTQIITTEGTEVECQNTGTLFLCF